MCAPRAGGGRDALRPLDVITSLSGARNSLPLSLSHTHQPPVAPHLPHGSSVSLATSSAGPASLTVPRRQPSTLRLIDLAPELLSEIFNEVYTDTSSTVHPICRALLPFQREALYRDPTWFRLSTDAVGKLVTTLTGSGLGALVKTFSIGHGGSDYNFGSIAFGLKWTADLFFNLPNIVSLDVPRLEGVTAVLLDLKDPLERLSRLRHLGIYLSAKASPEILTLLNDLPALVSLDLDLRAQEPPSSNVAMCKIRSLQLRATPRMSQSSRPVPGFIRQNFPALRSLILDSRAHGRFVFSKSLKWFSFLGSTLERLDILTNETIAGVPEWQIPCDQHLPLFFSLIELHLGAGTFTHNVGDALSRLPRLERLFFEPGALLPTDQIERLPNQVPRLNLLVLDQLSPPHPDCDNFIYDLLRDGTFTFEGLVRAVERIEKAGVEVQGAVIECLEVEKAARERKALLAGSRQQGGKKE